MKVAVLGGTGLIGSKVVARLTDEGHEAVAASPGTGVDTMTGAGLDRALEGADAVVDVTNSPSFEDSAVREFFEKSTRNILEAEKGANVGHHVVLSVVGTDRLPDSGYFRAKQAQENLIRDSGIPYTIVHATQFFEFLRRITDDATRGETVRLAPVLFQPISADDVASEVARVAVGPPSNGMVEVAGPDRFRLDELVRERLKTAGDPRRVVTDQSATYFGAALEPGSLVPGSGAHLGSIRLVDWDARQETARA